MNSFNIITKLIIFMYIFITPTYCPAICLGLMCQFVPYLSKTCCVHMNKCCEQYESW